MTAHTLDLSAGRQRDEDATDAIRWARVKITRRSSEEVGTI
jgi:hypothetical protein